MDRTWQVAVRGQIEDAVLQALPSDQMVWVSGHSAGGQRSATIWVRAESARSAETAVRGALDHAATQETAARLFVVNGASPVPWGASVGVPEEDAAALDHALSKLRRDSGQIGPLISSEPLEGLVTLSLDVQADSNEEAREKAVAVYGDLRESAGLAGAVPGRLEVHPPWDPGQRRHRELLDRAQALLDGGEFSLGVVIAQAAVEVLVKQIAEERLRARSIGALRAHLRYKASLADQQSRKLWRALTGDDIGCLHAWSDYLKHLDRRNDLVHEGIEVDQTGGSASIATCRAVIDHVEGLPSVEPNGDG